MKASFSFTHSVFLIEGGYVYTMGRNKEGQRGIRHCNPVDHPTLVETIRARYIVVSCHFYQQKVNIAIKLISFSTRMSTAMISAP